VRGPQREGPRGDRQGDHARKKGKAFVVPLDIADEAATTAQIRAVIRRHKRIDVLVNNAGVIHRENIVDTATADFRKVIETDLIGQFVVAREIGRHMLAREYGRIVNISSVMAVLGRASVAGYVSAKHGLVGLTKNLVAEYGPHVTANAIAPGYIRTELNVPLQKNKEFSAMLRATHRRRAAGARRTTCAARCCCSSSDAGAYHHRPYAGGRRRADDDPGMNFLDQPESFLMPVLGVGVVDAVRTLIAEGWMKDPSADQVRLCRHDRRVGRPMRIFIATCRSNGMSRAAPARSTASDTAFVRIDSSGESTAGVRLAAHGQVGRLGARDAMAERGASLKIGDIKIAGSVHGPDRQDAGRRAERRLRADRGQASHRRDAVAGRSAGAGVIPLSLPRSRSPSGSPPAS
jgi:NAD(P)-dependent dehydrogenase (short-subunit alcohol dehydrogenase family)